MNKVLCDLEISKKKPLRENEAAAAAGGSNTFLSTFQPDTEKPVFLLETRP